MGRPLAQPADRRDRGTVGGSSGDQPAHHHRAGPVTNRRRRPAQISILETRVVSHRGASGRRDVAMTWRATLRMVAIVLNGGFAIWLFASQAVCQQDYLGGGLVAIPPLV